MIISYSDIFVRHTELFFLLLPYSMFATTNLFYKRIAGKVAIWYVYVVSLYGVLELTRRRSTARKGMGRCFESNKTRWLGGHNKRRATPPTRAYKVSVAGERWLDYSNLRLFIYAHGSFENLSK